MDDIKFPNKYFLTTITDWDTYQTVKSLLGKDLKHNICICLVGKKQSGKTTIRKYITDKYKYNYYYFAKYL